MRNDVQEPIIVKLPYGDADSEDFKAATVLHKDSRDSIVEGMFLQQKPELMHFVLGYPTVYVVSSNPEDKAVWENKHTGKLEYTVYVGETNDIVHRTSQHLNDDPKTREDWESVAQAVEKDSDSYLQYVIGHPEFNKSLTLDVENRFMHYMSSTDSVKKLINGRTNAQGDYYTEKDFNKIFSKIWLELHDDNPELFPAEQIIRDSALFKASPFHKLSHEQIEAEESILAQLSAILADKSVEAQGKEQKPKLIFVEGAAGTGKTVLLSHLFYRIYTEVEDARAQQADVENKQAESQRADKDYPAYILVNHNEQVTVYNQIATKLGLQKKFDQVVMKPTKFINRFSKPMHGSKGRGDPNKPDGKADIVLVDEAHLLLTQGDQGYSGKNQLYDLLRRAKVVIAVFDPKQILQAKQKMNAATYQQLFPKKEIENGSQTHTGKIEAAKVVELGPDEDLPPLKTDVAHIRMEHQFRMAASQEMIDWIDDFADNGHIGKLPVDPGERDLEAEAKAGDGKIRWKRKPYEVKVFDSPVELFKAIQEKAELKPDGWNGQGLSRVLATYDWKYSSKSPNSTDPNGFWNVEMYSDADGLWKYGSKPGLPKFSPIEYTEDTDTFTKNGYYKHWKSRTTEDYFCQPWNYQLTDLTESKRVGNELAWAEQPHTINEIGSTFTIQGFDLNYAGVIIGPSVGYKDGHITFDPDESANYLAKPDRKDLGDTSAENLFRNELSVLLKRGVHGLYLFAMDKSIYKELSQKI
ncbi:DUF2075 domain-containing protein [Bifidobacterium sp. ESL0764]|uniref:DUF2075 domain-containing protein n=1 Tax=Bifidobacterium sp. ESL0764 TaxID=2983228 RepID=UPI0023FA45DA|nr:DUF2075 domain-containing protein [Bifidobacterium sp. ESL0764]WEV65354.1 DUF2075 domain-containing protein [Bifidobacterium sp. ESL0764]